MKTLLTLTLTLPALLFSAATLRAEPSAASNAAAPSKAAQLLDSLPAAVRETVIKAANGGRTEEVKIVNAPNDAGKIYLVEIELADDRDLDLKLSASGEILKSTEEVALSAAPEGVQAALKNLAGTTARIEDVKKVTKGQEVTWRAELDRKHTPDTKVRLDAQGKVLEQTEDVD